MRVAWQCELRDPRNQSQRQRQRQRLRISPANMHTYVLMCVFCVALLILRNKLKHICKINKTERAASADAAAVAFAAALWTTLRQCWFVFMYFTHAGVYVHKRIHNTQIIMGREYVFELLLDLSRKSNLLRAIKAYKISRPATYKCYSISFRRNRQLGLR